MLGWLNRYFQRRVSKFLKHEVIEFNLEGNNTIPLTLIKKPKRRFIANKTWYGLQIESTFFKFSFKEQRAIIRHEIYHTLFFTPIKHLFFLPFKKILKRNRKYNLKQLEEFDADFYSYKKHKKDTIRALKTIDKMVKAKKIQYDFKNHPSLAERIDRLVQYGN